MELKESMYVSTEKGIAKYIGLGKDDFLEQENKELKTLLKGTTHCYDEVEHKQLMEENKELKKQLDYALKLLAEMFLPCERDGFMYKYSDYCQSNCGVDEEVFKKCWLMYIEDKLKEVK